MATLKVKHPNLFEVNTRVLLSRYKKGQDRTTLKDIPDSYWKNLADKGMDWVWLMGVWTLKEKQINPNLIPENMMVEFKRLVPDLTEDDIDGSTYAIDDYTVDPVIGGEEQLIEIRNKLSQFGMRLMLDFIPNHYGANTHFIHSHPEYFIEVEQDIFQTDQKTFYSPLTRDNLYFAHGKDPYFDAWQDTIQVNYGSEPTRKWMTAQLLRIASLCDGVRCDMAMLPVKRIFEKTWSDNIKWEGGEFWEDAIGNVKDSFPQFILLAEVYWGMEAELLELGFDYCYDKTFYDKLAEAHLLHAHYQADDWYLSHTARFLENHDEPRIASRLHLRQHMAAAALVAFGPGMRFWHMGQWDGHNKQIPVQLTREPDESCGCLTGGGDQSSCGCISRFYDLLFAITKLNIFKLGEWHRTHTDSDSHAGLFLWQWKYNSQTVTVAINYSEKVRTIDPEQTGLSSDFFVKSMFLEKSDSYQGLQLRPWDIRIWEYMDV
jgi:Alpha amylase, catalytic domain